MKKKLGLSYNQRRYSLEKSGFSGVSGLFELFLLNNPLMAQWSDKQQGRRRAGKVQRFD